VLFKYNLNVLGCEGLARAAPSYELGAGGGEYAPPYFLNGRVFSFYLFFDQCKAAPSPTFKFVAPPSGAGCGLGVKGWGGGRVVHNR